MENPQNNQTTASTHAFSTSTRTTEPASKKQEEIRAHYAQVAGNILAETTQTENADSSDASDAEDVSASRTKGAGSANGAESADGASHATAPSLAFDNSCESCDTPAIADARAEAMLRGEAAQLYGSDVLAGVPTAALAASRGCGDPVAQAHLQPGERVLDLGSGGGIDAIIAARLVGESGRVYGLDMTAEMVELAQQNAREAGCANLEFVRGSAESIPLPDNSLDVVISNCVINLVQDKKAVFEEIKRVLKPQGRMVVSDIVAWSAIPAEAQADLQAITGCRSGIPLASDYQNMLRHAGFAESNLEPKTTYTWDVLTEKAQRKGRMQHLDALANANLRSAVDGACGSAIVTATA